MKEADHCSCHCDGVYVSVSVASLDDVTPEQLDALPVQYMDGRDNNCFEPPKYTRYL